MQPRTGAESASCALTTSWLYHSEKSCARVGSFSSAMRQFVRSSQMQYLKPSKLKSVSDACKCVNACSEKERLLLCLAGCVARHYNANRSARAFSSSCPASDLSEGETTP